MRRVPATELERGDWVVCSDGTRVNVKYVNRYPKYVVLRLEPQGTHMYRSSHRPFAVPLTTHFVKEDAWPNGLTRPRASDTR